MTVVPNRNRVVIPALTIPLVALLMFLPASPLASAAAAQEHKVYVAVVDKDGNPVKDMTAAELEVKEGGKVQEIALKPSTTPIALTLIVSDGGTGAYQQAAGTFMERAIKNASFKVVAVTEQAEVLTDYTSSVPNLTAAVQRLGRRSARRTSGQLLEAISDAIKAPSKEGHRPVIVVMRLGGEATTNLRSNVVREDLRKSGAQLFVVSPTGGGGTGASGMGVTRSQANSQGESDLANTVVLNQVIDDGSKDSGGWHEQVAPTTILKTLEQLADQLLNQYEVAYTLPAGTKPSDRLQVSSKRKNVRVFAPTRIPN
jgi:hypothetical protein